MDGLVNQLIVEAKGVIEEKKSFVWKDVFVEFPDLDKYKFVLLLTTRHPNRILLCKSYTYVDMMKCWVSCDDFGGLIKNSEIIYWMPFDFWYKFELPQASTN